MLENVPVNSVRISSLEKFRASELQNYEQGPIILSHIVRMSQEKGEWVTEFTLGDFFEKFAPPPMVLSDEEEFRHYFRKLLKAGYLEEDREAQTIKVTERFAELCERYTNK